MTTTPPVDPVAVTGATDASTGAPAGVATPPPAAIAVGTTPMAPILANPQAGVALFNEVARLLAISPSLVAVVVTVAVVVLGIDRRLDSNALVGLLGTVLAAHSAVTTAQSIRRTSS